MEDNRLTSDLKGHRTLATVVFTDCVGFSALMSVDEDHTLDLIRRDLTLMKQICETFEGRVLKSTGDGLLMCFVSAVKAVEYAVEIQTILSQRATNLASEDTLKHRVGIHLADIFITQTDVMGNGVNIAARLQAEAVPGGICVSQTVYDVVKANLHLRTIYLGPRELKNIREIVPVYRILLEDENLSVNLYESVVQCLEQDRNVLRIKKLLVYVGRNTWANDQSSLDAINLRDIISQVLELAPTLERLKTALDAAVQTLSKQAEYALVANTILQTVGLLYAGEARDRSPSGLSMPTSVFGQSPIASQDVTVLYDQIAHKLEQGEHSDRIKKLLFYVCHSRWENDLHRLQSIHLSTLIADLHRLAPTLEQLRSTLDRFVQTLSKQAEYSLIANKIISALLHLYNTEEEVPAQPAHHLTSLAQLPAPLPESSISKGSIDELSNEQNHLYNEVVRGLGWDPNLLRIKKLILYACWQQWESDPVKLDGINLGILVRELHRLAPKLQQLQTTLTTVVDALNKQAEYRPIAQTIISKFSCLYPSESAVAATAECNSPAVCDPASSQAATPPKSQLASIPQHQRINLFDYRLGIMKYANPLRAKILILSALHDDFRFTNQDWLNLKLYELDGLLRQLLFTCKTYTDLEALLYGAARRLQEPEETVQTATAVVQCLRSFYVHGNPFAVLEQPAEVAQLRSDPLETRIGAIATLDADDDYTCQILPISADLTEVCSQPLPSSPSPHQTPNSSILESDALADNSTQICHPSNQEVQA